MDAMTFLSNRAELSALTLLKRIYADLPQWGIKREQKHFKALLRGMCNAGKVKEAMAFADTSDTGLVMETDGWRQMLRAAVRHEPDLVPDIEERLRRSTAENGLSVPDYILLLRHLRVSMPDEAETRQRIRAILGETRTRGLAVGREGEIELVGIHLRLGDLERAGNIINEWKMGEDPAMWNALIDYRAATNDYDGVREAMAIMDKKGMAVYDNGLRHIVLHTVKERMNQSKVSAADMVNIVEGLELDFRSKLSSSAWAEVIELDPAQGVAVYDDARSRGVTIDTHMAKALIVPLAETNLPAALEVYADLTATPIVITTRTVRARLLVIYSALFRAYSRQPEDHDLPIRLLKDMRRSGLALPPVALTSLIISLIRSSPDHFTAFNNYAHLYALDPSALDAKAFNAIIPAFNALSTPTSAFAKPSYVMEMIKDMRKANLTPGPQILTSLLTTYGQQARKSRKSNADPVYRQSKLDSLHKAITEVHNSLKLESIVTPDIPLLNALMDAYSRVGAYSSAFEVWDLIVERRAHEPKDTILTVYGPSVSIILDTCARSGQLKRARRIWGWVKRHKLDSTKAWEGWIECLCKMQKVDEAAELVLEKGDITVEMLRILFKYSWTNKELFKALPDRIKEKYPILWGRVKDVIQTNTSKDVD